MSTFETFTPALLERVLTEQLTLSSSVPLRVAYSGGLDSHVLLHALAALRAQAPWRVSAIHVDHALHPDSARWAARCREICRELAIPIVVERVAVEDVRAHGLEGAARRARQAVYARLLAPGEVILTAHQRDDQAETVLLQLLRGAGVRGLAAMQALTPFAQGHVARPLLAFGRAALAHYAAAHGLRFIADPSNQDTRIARNFLRARVLPLLAARWPEAAEQLARAAGHSAQALLVLDEIAAGDVALSQAADGGLRISALQNLGAARRANTLRYWLRMQGVGAPAESVLDQVLAQVQHPSRTQHACIRWAGAELHRYRDTLVLLPPQTEPASEWEESWDPAVPLAIPGTGWRLRAQAAVGAGLGQARLQHRELRVRLRRGGESCRLPGREHRHKLKKMLQDAGVPPWERARLPLVYVDGELAAVADRWVCEPYAARPGEPSFMLVLDQNAVRT